MEHVSEEAKRRARSRIDKAQRKGKFWKSFNCEWCGRKPAGRYSNKANGIIAHHNDYKKPFDVNWICMKCHSQYHQSGMHKDKWITEESRQIMGEEKIKKKKHSNINTQEIGQRLKATRGPRTMAEMAGICGVSRQCWHLWESGRSRLPVDKAIILKEWAGKSLDWIYLGED